MKILVANLGSTSFKFRLFEMTNETQLAQGSIDRIGQSPSHCRIESGHGTFSDEINCPDHSTALSICLAQLDLVPGVPSGPQSIDGIGFKAVHGGRISGVCRVDDEVLAAMTEMNGLAPAHNPIYVNAMEELSLSFPDVPLVAAFETGFHQSQDEITTRFAIPYDWSERLAIKRNGFHGASHRYIAERIGQLTDHCQRTISLHLGGSSSLCAIRDGISAATTMGMSPQSGLPQSNRVGDFDPFALPLIMQRTQQTLDQVLEILAHDSGLLGISGVSGDIRDLQTAAESGNERAQLALDVYVKETRRHLGGLVFSLAGVDCIVFTGGTGEHGVQIRQKICHGLDELGIVIDEQKNRVASGESKISDDQSQTEIWVVPTNEEIVVARQTAELLDQGNVRLAER